MGLKGCGVSIRGFPTRTAFITTQQKAGTMTLVFLASSHAFGVGRRLHDEWDRGVNAGQCVHDTHRWAAIISHVGDASTQRGVWLM